MDFLNLNILNMIQQIYLLFIENRILREKVDLANIIDLRALAIFN
jgi:hypothetical protein